MTTAQITAGMVKELREKTSAGMMDCKRVLEETGGDMDEAVKLLRERGVAQASKLAGRETTEGRIAIWSDDSTATIVEVGCNTDFVARNDEFGAFCEALAQHIATNKPSSVDELLGQPWSGGDGTIEDWRTQVSASTGENVVVRRFEIVDGSGAIASYVHGGKIGVLVDIATSKSGAEIDEFGSDLAMHIAAMAPRYVSRDQVPAEDVEAEKAIYVVQAEDKPENVRERIAEGKLDKWFSEICLLEQQWVRGKEKFGKDTTIAEWAKQVGDVEIKNFTRYMLGE
jgi:elongation factor Ts